MTPWRHYHGDFSVEQAYHAKHVVYMLFQMA